MSLAEKKMKEYDLGYVLRFLSLVGSKLQGVVNSGEFATGIYSIEDLKFKNKF